MTTIACSIDKARSDVLRPCMINDYQLESSRPYVPFDPFANPDGFPLCCLSKQTVVYSCGLIARADDKAVHKHSAQEIKLCQRLAAEAMNVVEGLEVGMGSEGTPAVSDADGVTLWGTDGFSPFFIVSQTDERIPKRITESLIRRKFGSVIFSDCKVRVEALREKGKWWESVQHWYGGFEDEDDLAQRDRWRTMMEWFTSQTAFTHTGFVMIGDGPDDGGAHFPRLALGLTKAGSLVGIVGIVVHT